MMSDAMILVLLVLIATVCPLVPLTLSYYFIERSGGEQA